MTHFYLLHRPRMPWAEYGDILLAGLTERLPRQDGQLQLERAGPFVPPIAVAGDHIIVTDDFRHLMEGSGLTGFAFRPVVKRHIARLEWETWDRTAEDPPEYPDSGEPEDYFLALPHDPEVAEQMGALWEVVVEERGALERVRTGPNPWEARVYLTLDGWDGVDWFRARGYGFTYVTDRAKAWLDETAAGYVSCLPALVK